MTFYLTIWLYLFLLSLFEISKIKTANKITFFISILFLLLFAGFRFGIETDYWSYYKIFNSFKTSFPIYTDLGFDFLINFYLKNISKSFNGFIFFIAFLSFGIKYFFFKNTDSPFITLFIYYTLFYIFFEYNGIRQGLAASFILIASNFFKVKKWIGFFLLIGIAFTLHISSLLFLIVCFFNKSLSVNKLFIIVLVAFIARLFIYSFLHKLIIDIVNLLNIPILSHRIDQLLSYLNLNSKTFVDIGFLRRLSVVFIFILLCGKKEINNFYFNIYIIGFIFYIIFMGFPVLSARLSSVFEVFMAPMFSSEFSKQIFNWKTVHLFFILSLLLLLLLFTGLRNGYAIPYQTYLNI